MKRRTTLLFTLILLSSANVFAQNMPTDIPTSIPKVSIQDLATPTYLSCTEGTVIYVNSLDGNPSVNGVGMNIFTTGYYYRDYNVDHKLVWKYLDTKPISNKTTQTKIDRDISVNGVRIGRGATSAQNPYPSCNTAVGNWALMKNQTGIYLTAIGRDALVNNLTGNNNTALGTDALLYSQTGSDNTALGKSAMMNNKSGSNNIAIGSAAMYHSVDGEFNVAIGTGTLSNNLNGDNNTVVGDEAGKGIRSGSNNTLLGTRADVPDGSSNNIVITDGEGVQRIRVLANGNVGINNTNPSYGLDVKGDINASGTFRVNGMDVINVMQGQSNLSTNQQTIINYQEEKIRQLEKEVDELKTKVDNIAQKE